MGYPRHQTAPATLPHVERQKAVRDARVPRDPLATDPGGRTVYTLRREASRPGLPPELAEGLDAEQRAAVEGAGGRTLVLASAGAGKTRTLVATLARLIAEGVPAQAIVLATFTRRAAGEMVGRAGQATGADLSGMLAGTFHAICARLLREAGTAIGVPPGFTVLDPEDQSDLMALARDSVLGDMEARPSLPRPATLVGYAGSAAESGAPLAEVVVAANGRLADRVALIEEIVDRYAARKRDHALLDYADLLCLGHRLLAEDGPAAERLRSRIRWVLVDELHDVNPVQAAIVDALGRDGNVVAVADPDQAIYSWRGADPEVVSRFADAPGTRVFPLQTNYRSRPEIVALAQETLPAGNPWGKRLRASRPAGHQRPVIAHLASVADEAAFVTQRIADLITAGREPGDIAVLYRAHHHSVELQLALTTAGVEFELYSGARLVESAHIKDVLAFCRLRHNPRDELAWNRALRLLDGIGPATASRIWGRIGAAAEPVAELAAMAREAAAAGPLTRAAEVIAATMRAPGPAEIILGVGRSDWYQDRLAARYPNHRDRSGDIARVAELAARTPQLADFLHTMQLAERIEADEDVSGPAKRVALSSVHQAKGLEWPVAFILQVEAGSFPSSWAVSEGDLEEEERLFHVAVTRAADELYLCRPIEARRPWDTGANALVINSGQGFLDRDLGEVVEEWSVR